MHIGIIGLGKMGDNMRTRMRSRGVEVTGYDRNPDVSDVASLDDLVAQLPSPRTIWVMVPAGQITDAVIADLGSALSAGDTVIDGGNTRFSDDFAHSAGLAEKGINFVDVGVSGAASGDWRTVTR